MGSDDFWKATAAEVSGRGAAPCGVNGAFPAAGTGEKRLDNTREDARAAACSSSTAITAGLG